MKDSLFLSPEKEPTTTDVNPAPEDLHHVNRLKDAITAFTLALLCFAVLFSTVQDYGITWDEAAPNFVAARNQSEWFRNILNLERPFSRETIEHYWQTPSTHPSLTRSLMALSLLAFESRLGEIRAMRMPSMILASFLVGILYFWLARRVSTTVALGSVFCLVLFPRVFGHLHIASLDIPMMVWWALTVIVFYESARLKNFSFVHVLVGLVYGLALSTKLHSFFLPFPLLLWALLQRNRHLWRSFLLMALLSPLIYLFTQVYLWHDFIPKLLERFVTYSTKDTTAPVQIMYLGQRFIDRTPWHYPIVITLMTTPAVTLFYLILGTLGLSRRKQTDGIRSLVFLNIFIPLFIITLPHAQGYDGIRLILPAFPWLAILGGFGLDRLVEIARHFLSASGKRSGRLVLLVCFLILFIPNYRTLKKIRPFHLEYYADWLGGIPGGLQRGMETTYWCNTLQPELLEVMNRRIPDGASLRPLAMSFEVLEAYQRLGMLKDTIQIGGDPPYDYHLLQCRQGFFGRVEWAFYSGQLGPPLASTQFKEVPMFLFFGPLPGN